MNEEEKRYFAQFVTSRNDEAARSLRTLIDLPASLEEISGICKAEGVPATLLDLEGVTIGEVGADGTVTLK